MDTALQYILLTGAISVGTLPTAVVVLRRLSNIEILLQNVLSAVLPEKTANRESDYPGVTFTDLKVTLGKNGRGRQ